ncbi:hypothetical protein [Saccharopolyspora sp. CA-218241]|uniref:hypothetical protein n=1 Tax=Saccharopolyspora sp. CA-218241 TaxID=3240027 RepID=UPI003D999200
MGERGRRLAAGQRQLVAPARVELVDPGVLLDEPTAAPDPLSEAVVLAAAERVSRSRTTFVVAHRPGAAERIAVLDGGRPVAHRELGAAGHAVRRWHHARGNQVTTRPAGGTRRRSTCRAASAAR